MWRSSRDALEIPVGWREMRSQPVVSLEQLAAVMRDAPARADDASVTRDGRRLDSREKVLAFLAELEEERARERAGG